MDKITQTLNNNKNQYNILFVNKRDEIAYNQFHRDLALLMINKLYT